MFLEVKNIVKSYKQNQIIKGVSFHLDAQQNLAILGKSGCGKTTLLKLIAAIEKPDSGSVVIQNTPINQIPVQSRGVVYLYQEPLLFSHLSVFENLAFGLKIKKMDAQTIKLQVNQLLQQLELESFAHQYPDQLSGGQKQRVNFGRAIITKPRLLLLDEPFGSLDAQTRAKMQSLYLQLAKEYNISSILVTHDVKEALILGTQFALLDAGKLHIYNSKDEFKADEKTGVQNELNFWSEL